MVRRHGRQTAGGAAKTQARKTGHSRERAAASRRLTHLEKPAEALIILTPVLLPIATDSYHIDPIHFGVVICVNLTLGLLTPPVGSGLFIATALTGVKPERIARAALPFIVAAMAVVLLITVEPRLVTALL